MKSVDINTIPEAEVTFTKTEHVHQGRPIYRVEVDGRRAGWLVFYRATGSGFNRTLAGWSFETDDSTFFAYPDYANRAHAIPVEGEHGYDPELRYLVPRVGTEFFNQDGGLRLAKGVLSTLKWAR
jgi:hypothetical protein